MIAQERTARIDAVLSLSMSGKTAKAAVSRVREPDWRAMCSVRGHAISILGCLAWRGLPAGHSVSFHLLRQRRPSGLRFRSGLLVHRGLRATVDRRADVLRH